MTRALHRLAIVWLITCLLWAVIGAALMRHYDTRQGQPIAVTTPLDCSYIHPTGLQECR